MSPWLMLVMAQSPISLLMRSSTVWITRALAEKGLLDQKKVLQFGIGIDPVPQLQVGEARLARAVV
ncbi:MAG: hypothetical protein R3D56_00665 [Paracoccaceae bacterium]